jgi:hypothetical protein
MATCATPPQPIIKSFIFILLPILFYISKTQRCEQNKKREENPKEFTKRK